MYLIMLAIKVGKNNPNDFQSASFWLGILVASIPVIITGFFSILSNHRTNKLTKKLADANQSFQDAQTKRNENFKTQINGDNHDFQEEQREKNEQFKKSINDTNNSFQEKITNHQISANIKAQSRINWIQDVRIATTNLIISYFEYWSNDNTQKDLNKVHERTILLSLYFGDKRNEYGISIASESFFKADKLENDRLMKLLKKDSDNDGKNAIIVDLIKSLYSALESTLPSKTESIVQKNIENYLIQLQEVISLYLKIEWDRAKNNDQDKNNNQDKRKYPQNKKLSKKYYREY